jgi:hypothetical protein
MSEGRMKSKNMLSNVLSWKLEELKSIRLEKDIYRELLIRCYQEITWMVHVEQSQDDWKPMPIEDWKRLYKEVGDQLNRFELEAK